MKQYYVLFVYCLWPFINTNGAYVLWKKKKKFPLQLHLSSLASYFPSYCAYSTSLSRTHCFLDIILLILTILLHAIFNRKRENNLIRNYYTSPLHACYCHHADHQHQNVSLSTIGDIVWILYHLFRSQGIKKSLILSNHSSLMLVF